MSKKSIFVVESGWVFLAEDYTKAGKGYTLAGACTIRKWGTTAGLGSIALDGPTKNTVLDPCGNPYVPEGKVLFIIPCSYADNKKGTK